ncbi:hypothetical protein [Hirschia litorea]|uniref:Uncharacterized protein n=1 Tax=Hirschia litorea TaxID=1199156 RepID=A0ABW2IKL5_9PROT
MHASTLKILEIIKRSRHHFTDLELADFIHDIRKTENAALIPLLKPKTRTVYSFVETDPQFLEFQSIRKQLLHIHNEDYISDIVRVLNACKMAEEFDLRQFHKKSIPAFYDAITQIITPETLIEVAMKYTAHRMRRAA